MPRLLSAGQPGSPFGPSPGQAFDSRSLRRASRVSPSNQRTPAQGASAAIGVERSSGSEAQPPQRGRLERGLRRARAARESDIPRDERRPRRSSQEGSASKRRRGDAPECPNHIGLPSGAANSVADADRTPPPPPRIALLRKKARPRRAFCDGRIAMYTPTTLGTRTRPICE